MNTAQEKLKEVEHINDYSDCRGCSCFYGDGEGDGSGKGYGDGDNYGWHYGEIYCCKKGQEE